MRDLERAKYDLSLFCDRVQQKIPGWKYLAVLQRQKRGAYHSHLAVRGWQNVVLLRNIWLSVVGLDGGNIDAAAPKKRSGTYRWGRLAVAKYISRYIGKDLEDDELNKKRYFHSKNVESPEVVVIPLDCGFYAAREWARHLARSVGRVACEYLGPWSLWLCTV